MHFEFIEISFVQNIKWDTLYKNAWHIIQMKSLFGWIAPAYLSLKHQSLVQKNLKFYQHAFSSFIFNFTFNIKQYLVFWFVQKYIINPIPAAYKLYVYQDFNSLCVFFFYLENVFVFLYLEKKMNNNQTTFVFQHQHQSVVK